MAGDPVPERRPRRPQQIAEGVGAHLRARREEQGVSLRELARRLQISPSALSQIETGKSRPSVGTLYAIVSELRMSLDELFAASPTARRPSQGDERRAGTATAPPRARTSCRSATRARRCSSSPASAGSA
jgi:transcriptional regulator with XRE-family HTH domain